MGPAPMIRMVEMSVLLGIKSQRLENGHKKRARLPRVPQAVARVTPRARVVFRPDSAAAKGSKTGHQRGNQGFGALRPTGSPRFVYAFALPWLCRTRFAPPFSAWLRHA